MDTGGDPGAEALVAEPDAGGSFFTGRPVAGAARDPWDERESPAGLVSAARRICAGFGALGEAFWTPGGRQARQQETVALRELRLAQVQLQREMNRKNKALAEAAALRVLPKKIPGAVGGRGRMSAAQVRTSVTALIAVAVTEGARLAAACAVIGISARPCQRWQGEGQGIDGRILRHEAPGHRLSSAERAELLAVANSAEFGHLPPSQIVPRLADPNRYLASESTFYRVFPSAGQLAHRRRERVSRKRAKPRALAATGPNQIDSWDITYLPTRVLGLYFYLYLFVHVFSRQIVAWQVYAEESGEHAGRLVEDLCWREGIVPGQVTLHADSGGSLKGSTMRVTLQTLGVMPSLSRPAVSHDNPYAESLFKTLKYRPEYPLRPCADRAAARTWVTTLVRWYNHDHRHGAIRFVTRGQRHAGLDAALLAIRHDLYAYARLKNLLRWKRQTRNWRRVTVVHLNPDKADKTEPNEPGNSIEKQTAVNPLMRQVA